MLKTAETIDLEAANMWVRLEGELHKGRHSCGTCVYRHKAYLLMGVGANDIELFDLVKRRFVEGPELVLPEAEGCVAWLHAGQITIISKAFVTKIDFRESAPKLQSQAHPEMVIHATSLPAVSGHNAYWSQADGYVKATMNRVVILLECLTV